MTLKRKLIVVTVLLVSISLTAFIIHQPGSKHDCCNKGSADNPNHAEGCVFKTVMGEDSLDANFVMPIPENVNKSIDVALKWMVKAQLPDGGWGAGYSSNQGEMNPQNVKSDPATTAMVTMALLRCNNTLTEGEYSKLLQLGTEYLITATLESDPKTNNITTLTGTQPQVKLGGNIDVVLTAQFFSNMLDYLKNEDDEKKNEIKKCLDICVAKIEKNQERMAVLKITAGRVCCSLLMQIMHWNLQRKKEQK